MKQKLLSIFTASAVLTGCVSNLGIFSTADWKNAQTDPATSAKIIVAKMSNREKIGQTIMIDFRRWVMHPYSDKPINVTTMNNEIASIIHDFHLGGVILFRQNVENTTQTIKLVQDIQDARSNIPLFISIDQEGGYVTRLQNGTEMPGNMALGASGNTKFAYISGCIHGAELSSMGINFNLGPVIDVNINQENPIIGVRSYSSNLDIIDKMSTAYIKGIQSYNMTISLKHFPGHGNVTVDSHYAIPIVDYSREEWENIDLAAFKNAIENGADSILIGHISVPSIDNTILHSEKTGMDIPIPSTFSKKMITDILRKQLGFEGIVITDALDMGAISSNFDNVYSVKMSFNAGVDIVLMPLVMTSIKDKVRLEKIYMALEKKMAKDDVFHARITEAAERVVRTKLEKAITVQQVDQKKAISIVASAENKAMEAKIAEKSITLIENKNVLPVSLTKITNILIISDKHSCNELIENELRNIADNKPIFINKMKVSLMGDDLSAVVLANNIKAADFVIVASYNLKEEAKNAQAIIDATNKKNVKTVLISTCNPYDIGYLNNVKANIAVYGIKNFDITKSNNNSLEANIRAGIRTLFIDENGPLNNPTAKLPVQVNDANGQMKYELGHGMTYKF